jgi:hypothetical protein
MAPYRSTRRMSRTSSSQTMKPIVAFLLIASFGILFAGCSGPSDGDAQEEDFSFTQEDVEKLQELKDDAGEDLVGSDPESIHLELPSDEEGESDEVLQLSLQNVYKSIRSDSRDRGDDVYRVIHPFLNVRKDPHISAEILERLQKGALLNVIDFTDAVWANVEVIPDGPEGFVAQRYIAKLTSERKLSQEKEKYESLYFVDFGFLNVRKDPDSQSEKLGELSGQSFVEPLSKDDTWARIPFDGREAYVAAEYLSPFLPNFLVRQEEYTLPILAYDVRHEGMVGALARHIDRLKQEEINIMTVRDFYELLLAQEDRDIRLDPQSVIVAVTGVQGESLKEVSDLLRISGISATLFIETQYLSPDNISDKNILTLLANGIDIQSGSHTGDDLRALTNAQVELELKQSKRLLMALTKKPPVAVAYPRGGVNFRITEIADQMGYLLGMGTAPDRVFTRDQLLRMPSFTIYSETTSDEMMRLIRGDDEL